MLRWIKDFHGSITQCQDHRIPPEVPGRALKGSSLGEGSGGGFKVQGSGGEEMLVLKCDAVSRCKQSSVTGACNSRMVAILAWTLTVVAVTSDGYGKNVVTITGLQFFEINNISINYHLAQFDIILLPYFANNRFLSHKSSKSGRNTIIDVL
ncbi:hypothetical protein D9C73_010993 [Scomber scombrus]|uniref:Uncharacterized protein n=1 Tax=Scomber scombrus TaxID=13677 RepID=A0AAV1PHA3_SCOSC